MILILGAPRSGTSWLGKIFDSHPDVLYRHEPDSALPTDEFPFLCPPDEVALHLPKARAYIERIAAMRDIKSMGVIPAFRKNYHTRLQHSLRESLILLVKMGERIGVPSGVIGKFQIPDFITPEQVGSVTFVLKSVIALGRARLFSQASPDIKTIIILRHPCGHVASIMRGVALGKHPGTVHVEALSKTEQARRRNLDVARLGGMDLLEQLAWRWVILNEKAIEETEELRNVRILLYEDLCRSPEKAVRDMFAFTGVPWHPMTEAFIRQSTAHSGSERYFQIYRNSLSAAEKWKTELCGEDIDRIITIAADSHVSEICKVLVPET